jgi:V8-like Glu-specific endopeptidase
MPEIHSIRNLVAADQLKEALTGLQQTPHSEQNMVIQLMGQLTRLERNEHAGLISFSDATLTRNKLRYAILSLLTDIEIQFAGLPEKEMDLPDRDVFEKLMTGSNFHRIDWLRTGLEKSNCVCKIHSPGSVGTGFLVADRYVFTNNHVIDSEDKLKGTQIEFGYDDPGVDSVLYDLEPGDFRTSPFSALDYTRVRIKEDSSRKAISAWGALQISTAIPKASDALTIIQHPRGRRKEIAFSEKDNSVWEHRLHYKISTEPGSSGSPVFDMNWHVVALHHAGGDLPVNAKGETKYVNEGILFAHILKDLESKT